MRKLKGIYHMRNVDKVIVPGKAEPVTIHEVLDYHTDETFPNMMEVVNYFNDGIHRYQGGQWTEAIKAFEKALKSHPRDQLSRTYIERCEYMHGHPPQGDWTGVWVMTSK